MAYRPPLFLLNISYLPLVPGRQKRNEAIFIHLLKDTGLFSGGIFINPVCTHAKYNECKVDTESYDNISFPVSQLSLSGPLHKRSNLDLKLIAGRYAELIKTHWIKGQPYLLWMNTAERFEYFLARHLLLEAKIKLFDLSDDFTTFKHSRPHIFNERLNRLIEVSDGLLCVNKYVQNKFPHRRSVVLNNGTDFDSFQRVDAAFTMPPLFPKLPHKKYIGYCGGILERRMDMKLLRKLFDKFSDCVFVFVGYYNNRRFITEFMQDDHVYYFPEVPYSQLQNIVSSFDVAIIPHQVNEATSGNDLLKLYDYLACGIPVVSTPCSDLQRFDSLIYVISDPDHFCDMVESIIGGDISSNSSAAKQYAKSCSWESRIRILSKWLEDDIIGRGRMSSV